MDEKQKLIEAIREYVREKGFSNALEIVATFTARGEFDFAIITPHDMMNRVPCADIKVVEYTNRSVEAIPRYKDLFYYDPRGKE